MPTYSRRLQGAGGEFARAGRQGASDCLQYSQCGQVQAGVQRHWRGAQLTARCHSLCQGPHRLREADILFGLVQEKIAQTAAEIYATEAVLYRVVGAIDAALAELDKNSPTFTQDVQRRIEEFAVECSILKVFGSEMVERVVDRTLQIHGGYGYVEEYPVERSYRDARINKIFEGTNEINRLITTGWMLKRALQGTLPLLPAIKKVMDEVMAGPAARIPYEGPLAEEHALLASAKKISLFCSGVASQKFGNEFAEQQEVMGALADILSEVLALESIVLRTEKMNKSTRSR